ncbi:urea ABC transporter permease subunit UrtB [Paraflavisolibacter sp. H34]|uniref:urea ABC transporter permease subunit UrtB n=1 Tax=Huijunlia imazamoxiresistens TaxID=3127457 RepID=UPI0030192814
MTDQLFSLLFNGLSISSILLLTALGLSIAFGMMGVINFAHGEFIMIGSYSSFIIGKLMGPEPSMGGLAVSFVLAFVLAAAIGWVLERTLIHRLYGRPIYSILATWGVSLILQQAARNLFGSNNVEAAIPKVLSQGIRITGNFQMPYNRLLILAVCLSICAAVYYFLYRTAKGRVLQAVMQNREMAACMGIQTRKADALTFSIGCGIAGIAGVCISMLGSIGPSTGQNYIMDAFLVVILGGIGGLRGTILGALLVGITGPYIEFFTTSSTAKALILTLVLVVLQVKPAGLAPLKDRALN